MQYLLHAHPDDEDAVLSPSSGRACVPPAALRMLRNLYIFSRHHGRVPQRPSRANGGHVRPKKRDECHESCVENDGIPASCVPLYIVRFTGASLLACLTAPPGHTALVATRVVSQRFLPMALPDHGTTEPNALEEAWRPLRGRCRDI